MATPARDKLCVFERIDTTTALPADGGAFNTKRATATTSLESPTIPPGVLNCAQLLSLEKTRNIKVGPAPNRAAGYPATVCSLTRTNVRGSILLSTASLAAVGAAEAHANTTYGITSLVVYYSEKGAGSSIVVTPNAGGRSTAISSSNTTLAAATAGVWSPKKVLAPLPSLAHNVTIELSPFPAGAAVQLVSVEFSIAAVPEQPMPSGMLKGYKPSAGLASTTVLQQLKEFSSNDLYNGSYGGPGSASDVSAQMLMLPSLIVAVSAKLIPDFLSNGFVDNDVLCAYLNLYLDNPNCYRATYDRGGGTIPNHCGDRENSGGLCYERCGRGYYGISVVCWQHCWAVSNEGWEDHRVTCHIPMHSYGLWTHCRSCNPGYKRDGCICTRSPRWHTKHTYTRGAIMPTCPSRTVNEERLCYKQCDSGFSGEWNTCYNHCPDAFPHKCGPSVCAKDSASCGKFIGDAALSVIKMVKGIASAFSDPITGGAKAVKAIASGVEFFSSVKTCDKYPIHLKSNAAILEVRDRDFAGTDLQSFLIPPGDAGWDSCLIVCKSNPECQFVVMSPPSSSWWMPRLSTCVLKKDIARDGRQGRNAHFAGLRVGVLIKRLTAEQVGWQWACGDGVVPGEVLSIPGESSSSISDRYLWHANGDQPNTFV